MSLLQISDLSVRFPQAGTAAVDHVSFHVDPGERIGLIGESGSGKSMVCLTIQGLQPAAAKLSGSIQFDDLELLNQPESVMRSIRGRRVGAVFQEPMTALNPVVPIWRQLVTASLHHGLVTRRNARALATDLAGMVDLPDPRGIVERYPHELSGGQRQRVVIAMALSAQPALVLADEPTTALDATVARKVLELMTHLCEQLGSALVLVTHDMGLAAGTSDRILVMRQGRLVESAATPALLDDPGHPYTRQLLAAARSTSLDLAGARRALAEQAQHTTVDVEGDS